MQEVGGTLCASHVDSDMIRAYFERRRKIMSAEVLKLIAREGMPAENWVGINLESELEYGNHRNAAKYGRQVLEKAL